MAALISLRLERQAVIDIASGEPDLPYSDSRRGLYQLVSNDDIVIVDNHLAPLLEYPVRVFIDENITAEEAVVHEEVERILINRKVAAVCLQRWWREESSCKRFRNRLRRKLLCRSLWLWRRRSLIEQHGVIARVIAQKAIETAQFRNVSASRIVSAWRGIRLRRYCRSIAAEGKRVLHLKRSASLIISHFHRYVVQRQAVLTIQTCWRNHLTASSARSQFLVLKSASSTAQACLSTFAAFNEHCRNIRRARILQNRFRRRRLRRKFRDVVLLCHQTHINALERSALCLQSVWRGRCCRHSLAMLSSKAVIIQRSWRCYRARQEYQRLREQESIARISACCWSILAGSRFHRLRSAAELLQTSFLSVIAFDRHVEDVQSIRILQHIFRRNRVRRSFRNIVLLNHREYRCARDRAAVCVQAIWRGRNCRRSLGGSFKNLRTNIVTCQAELWSFLACKEFQRFKKQSELDSRRQMLITQLELLPDSRDQRLQSLRERFSQRLATIECVSPEEPQEPTTALPVKASVLSALDAKRARLFRVKAQLDMIKGRKEPVSVLNDTSSSSMHNADDAKIVKSVRWCDDHGSLLADSTNPKCSPKASAAPARSCIKVSTNSNSQRKRAQRIINVLSTTFGKARVCRTIGSSENSSKTANLKSATMPAARTVAKSPLSSGARRVRVPTKFS